MLEGDVADITHALQRLTEAPHVASLSTAVSRATSRISAMSERSSEEFPIPGPLLHEILKVYIDILSLFQENVIVAGFVLMIKIWEVADSE